MTLSDGADHPSEPLAIQFVLPVYNDWAVVRKLLVGLDAMLAEQAMTARVLLVDDGSTQTPADSFECPALSAVTQLDVLRLRRNLGHQRAIAIGLCYVHDHLPADAVVVMDADGEDSPDDVPALFERFEAEGRSLVVFAARSRRSESLAFQIGYRTYQIVHLVLTGLPVRVGNFSIVPWGALQRLVVVAELWNHYAAAVINARIERTNVPLARAARLGGQSKMNLTSLIVHGLSALSVFAQVVGVRVMLATGSALAAILLALLPAYLAVSGPIPGWLPMVGGFVLLALLQVFLAALVIVFIVLGGRQTANFLPLSDYPHFVSGIERIQP